MAVRNLPAVRQPPRRPRRPRAASCQARRIDYIRVVPSTTVHFPPPLLERVDAIARRRGVSRNKFVVGACQEAVTRDAGAWPPGFFAPALTADELALLRAAGAGLEQSALSARRNRGAAPL